MQKYNKFFIRANLFFYLHIPKIFIIFAPELKKIAKMTSIILVVVLVLAGVALLVAELFLLPGFGIAGVGGFASLIGSVVVAYLKISALAGHITLASCVVLSALAIYGFLRSKAIEKMSLDTKIDSKVELAKPGKKIEKLKVEN